MSGLERDPSAGHSLYFLLVLTCELLMTRYVGDTARLYPKTPDMKALLGATRRAGGGCPAR